MNPILDATELALLRARVAEKVGTTAQVPCFDAPGGRTKVSAAWLIERAGFGKGHGAGRVGISRKHALAGDIQAGVRAAFGVELVREPVVV
jgi:UDP-N-acetylmuramate dehydrogenase